MDLQTKSQTDKSEYTPIDDATQTRTGEGPEMVGSQALDSFFDRHKHRNFAAFWLLGMINNFHYCLVLSASNDIAESYHLKRYVAMISWANVAGGIFVRLLNAFVFPSMPYTRRFIIAGLQTIIGVIIVSFATYWGSNDTFRFLMSLLGVMCVGNGSSWGESVALGYMERFPSKMVGGWSSGTGMSGVLSTLIFMGFQGLGVSNTVTFMVSLVLVLAYWASFYLLIVSPLDNETYRPTNNWTLLSWTAPEIVPADVNHMPEPTNGGYCSFFRSQKFKEGLRLHNRILFNNVNLFLVYVFEYAVQFVAPFSFPCEMTKNTNNFIIKNSFVITQFCYQVGVLISRSSLACFRIRHVEILTALQFMNSIAWFIQAKLLYLGDSSSESQELKFAFVLFVWMVFVGLLGGASYVNVFYNLLEKTKQGFEDEAVEPDPMVLKERRQLCMNFGSLYAVAGITMGCLVDVIFSNSVLSDTC